MKQCVKDHIEITWYDDGSPCPVCQAIEESAEKINALQEEVDTLKKTIEDITIGGEDVTQSERALDISESADNGESTDSEKGSGRSSTLVLE